MDLRSQYQSLSKDALIDKLLALEEQHSLESRLNSSSQNVSTSHLERFCLEHVSDGVVITDQASKILWWNPGAEKMFGYAADEALGQGVGELLHSTLESKYRLAIREGLEKEGLWIGAIPALCKDGSLTLCDSVILARVDADGQVVGTLGINRNTGWQSKAEAAISLQQGTQLQLDGSEAELAASLQRYTDLIECIPDVVWTVDVDGIITYVSPAAEVVTGFKPKELIGKHFYAKQEVVLDSNTPASALRLIEILLHPETRDDGFVARNVYRRADGSLLDAEVRVSPQLSAGGKVIGLSGITRDIGDIVQAQQARLGLEKQLLQAQKMEAIGQLAGGIAHDLNNVLTAIIGHTELLLLDLKPSSPQFSGLTEIDKSSQRAARLVKNLLAFSRQQDLHPQLIDMREGVGQMQEFLRGLLGGAIEFSITTGTEPLWVLVDLTQLEQVVMNLVVNARDAIIGSGQIHVGMGLTVLDGLQQAPLSPGQYVELSVTDTGSGIESGSIPRVFEPFYTTKKPNLGTGLGLSGSYGIIQQSGGTINAVSEVGVGTTFSVYLPLTSTDAAAKTTEGVPSSSDATVPLATILVAEDNPEVGAMLQRVLQQYGYAVILAHSAEEALEIASHTIGRIDLLVTDFVMPGMNGVELSGKVATLHKETKVLHMSGFSDAQFGDSDDELLAHNFLPKPFGPKALLERVGQILEIS